MNIKKLVADKATELVQEEMTVGLGTGSTAYWAIQKLGQRVQQGLNIKAVPTSIESERLAKKVGIPLAVLSEINEVDITIDGADEISHNLDLIKGGGGALLREKLVAAISKQLVIIADESKWIKNLGAFPLPVEIVPFGWEITQKQIQKFGCTSKLRLKEGKPYFTDNGNYILECKFNQINSPKELDIGLNLLPGVVENGLFVEMADIVYIATNTGSVNVYERKNLKIY